MKLGIRDPKKVTWFFPIFLLYLSGIVHLEFALSKWYFLLSYFIISAIFMIDFAKSREDGQ